LLCLLYGATPEYLGIARITKGNAGPSPKTTSPVVTDQGVVDALGRAAAILDQLGPTGGILQPRMFDAWRDDLIHRRVVLKLMGIMPAVTALPSVAESARRSRSGKPTPDNIRNLEQLADRYQALYHSTAPAALMTPVVAHLSTLGDLLRQGPAPAERHRLLVNRARVGTLAGWLSFFDLQDPMAARSYYSLALEAPESRVTTGRPSPRSDTSPSFPPWSTGSRPRWTTCTAPVNTSGPNHMVRWSRGWPRWSRRCTPTPATPPPPCTP
jgi:hypothetical protein